MRVPRSGQHRHRYGPSGQLALSTEWCPPSNDPQLLEGWTWSDRCYCGRIDTTCTTRAESVTNVAPEWSRPKTAPWSGRSAANRCPERVPRARGRRRGVTGRMLLRIDPWAPEYDAALQLVADDAAEDTVEALDLTVEVASWQPIIPKPTPRPLLWFVDGVRRVDLRVLTAESQPLRYGVLGSLAVGAVRAAERAEFDQAVVRRALVMGCGLVPDPIHISVENGVLDFAGHP